MKKEAKILGIRADWKALTFCILAACTFWLLNALNQDYTDNIAYPFRIEYDPSKITPLEPLPEKININVTGYGWIMLRKSIGINADPVIVKFEKLPKKEFLTSAQLATVVSRQLTDLRLNFVAADTIFFDFDQVKTKKLKVVLDSASFSLAPSWHLVTPVIISPETLSVKGPASLVRKVPDSIKVQVSAENIRGEYEETVKIPEYLFDLRIKLLQKEVKVRFTAVKFEKESLVLNVKPIKFPEDTSKYTFERKIILTYFVKEEDKGKVKPGDFEVILDYRKLDKKDQTIIPVLSKKPPFIRDYYFTPYAIKVRKKE